MLIPLRRLLLRTRHVRSRAEELLELSGRIRAEQRARASSEERTAAEEVRGLKIRVTDALASVEACAHCATGKPAPRGVFVGGDCCGGVTAELFSDDEVAALARAGTTVGALRAPRTEHAGCAFRGSAGCTLAPADRPERCVTYACGTLRRELHARGTLASIETLVAELRTAMQRFNALRRSRLDDELIGVDT